MITIYKASAGSGKTFTLALRYIALTIGWRDSGGMWHLNRAGAPSRHGSILAVTFTNKATAEMKTRIVTTLAALADPDCPPDNSYMRMLDEQIFVSSTRAEISAACRRALMQLLFDFGSFNVSTIDSFFQTVLRTFARELNLPDNYRIQLNQREAIDSAVHDMLDVINGNSPYFPESREATRAGRKARMREWILSFMESRMAEGQAFNLFNRATSTFAGLAERLSILFNETYKLHADEIDSWFDADSGERVIKLRDALQRRLATLRGDLAARTTALLSRTAPMGDNVISRNLMASVRLWVQGKPATGSTPVSAADGKVSACVYAAFKNDQALIDDIAGVCRLNLNDQEQIATVSFLLRNLYPLGLFGEMRRHLEKYCREENMVLQSNTNDFLARIISTEEEAPFIYERLGLRLQHFLLDEFQDTSGMQWRILRPLLLESLSNGHDNLIIGDGKQSIYSFRNTDFRLLNHIVGQEIGARGFEVNDMGTNAGENVNYRSSHTIVRFNNAVFDAIPRVYDLTPSGSDVSVYAGAVQDLGPNRAGDPGYVNVAFLNKEKGDDAVAYADAALARMLDGVMRQLRAGYRPRQIAVLVRKRAEGEMVVKHLLNAMDTPEWAGSGLPRVQVMSSDALLVGESPLVRMLVARLRMLLNPPEPRDNDGQRRYPGATQRDLVRLVNRYHMHLFASGGDPARALSTAVGECSPRFAATEEAGADDRLLSSPTSNLVTMVERIVREAMEEMEAGAAADAEVHSVYLSGFMDLVGEYASRCGNDLRGFLEWWDTKRATQSINVPGDVDAINVLTIHKAKGLEFPCVHVPFLSFCMTETSTAFKRSYRWYRTDPIPGIDPDLIPPYIPLENLPQLASLPGAFADGYNEFIAGQKIDNINLLYVALTRPTRELVVTALIGDESNETVGNALLKAVRTAAVETPLKFSLTSRLDADTLTLVIGEPTPPPEDTATAATAFMPPYATHDNDRLLEITKLRDRFIRDFSNQADRYIFLKRVLAQTRGCASLPAVVRREAHRSRLEAGCAAEALSSLTAAISTTPEASGWFDGYTRLLLVPEIFAGNLPKIRRWRPDRIVWRADGFVDVVECCTDGLPDTQLATLRAKVASVMRQLAAMGHTGIRGFLWNIDTASAMRVTLLSGD